MNVLSKVLQLDDFSIEEIGPIRVDIHGLGFLFNWLAEEVNFLLFSFQQSFIFRKRLFDLNGVFV